MNKEKRHLSIGSKVKTRARSAQRHNMITIVTVESLRNAENAVDIAALENPVGKVPGVDVPAVVADMVGEPKVGDPEGPPDPPAAVDNWANPTDAGEERNTVYTFFRNVSPTTQSGAKLTELGGILLEPGLRSKIAPTHKGLPSLS